MGKYSRFITGLIAPNLMLSFLRTVENLHAIWVRVDETLPWMELKGTYETRKDAKEAANNCLHRTQIRIIAILEKDKQRARNSTRVKIRTA
jgi:hypothetical protein